MSEEIKKEESTASSKTIIRDCNRTPEFYIFFQDSCKFQTFASEDSMKEFLVDYLYEMEPTFGLGLMNLRSMKVDELLMKHDEAYLKFLHEIRTKVTNKEEFTIMPYQKKFETNGRIYSNYSVYSIPLTESGNLLLNVSKSLFYRYLELLKVSREMNILDMSAVFMTSSYADGSLSITQKEGITEEEKNLKVVKMFIIFSIDCIGKRLIVRFADPNEQTAPEKSPEQPNEQTKDESSQSGGA